MPSLRSKVVTAAEAAARTTAAAAEESPPPPPPTAAATNGTTKDPQPTRRPTEAPSSSCDSRRIATTDDDGEARRRGTTTAVASSRTERRSETGNGPAGAESREPRIATTDDEARRGNATAAATGGRRGNRRRRRDRPPPRRRGARIRTGDRRSPGEGADGDEIGGRRSSSSDGPEAIGRRDDGEGEEEPPGAAGRPSAAADRNCPTWTQRPWPYCRTPPPPPDCPRQNDWALPRSCRGRGRLHHPPLHNYYPRRQHSPPPHNSPHQPRPAPWRSFTPENRHPLPRADRKTDAGSGNPAGSPPSRRDAKDSARCGESSRGSPDFESLHEVKMRRLAEEQARIEEARRRRKSYRKGEGRIGGEPNRAATNKRTSTLDGLGLCWSPVDEDAEEGKDERGPTSWDLNWKKKFEELRAFKSRRGHLQVQRRSSSSKCRSLARWIIYQRKQHRRRERGESSTLNDERLELLEGLGFDFDGTTRDDDDNGGVAGEEKKEMKPVVPHRSRKKENAMIRWRERLEELRAFRLAHGHVRPRRENPALQTWIYEQRKQYVKLRRGKASRMTPEKIEALKELGFRWKTCDQQWDDNFEELRAYRQVHGHCNVSAKPRTSDNPRLGRWVVCQRALYKLKNEGKPSSLTDERQRKLEELGIMWSRRPARIVARPRKDWYERYEELVEALGDTYERMRPKPTRWDVRFDELVQFYCKHGHMCVPRVYEEYRSLADWVTTQRTEYRLRQKGMVHHMYDNRLEALESLGFQWSARRNELTTRPEQNRGFPWHDEVEEEAEDMEHGEHEAANEAEAENEVAPDDRTGGVHRVAPSSSTAATETTATEMAAMVTTAAACFVPVEGASWAVLHFLDS